MHQRVRDTLIQLNTVRHLAGVGEGAGTFYYGRSSGPIGQAINSIMDEAVTILEESDLSPFTPQDTKWGVTKYPLDDRGWAEVRGMDMVMALLLIVPEDFDVDYSGRITGPDGSDSHSIAEPKRG